MVRRFVTSPPPVKPAGPGTRRSRRSRPGLEALEGRQLMSIGPPFVVDTPENTYKNAIVTSSSSNGSMVAVWVEYAETNNGQDFGVSDIQAQYFNASGNKAGPEIYVAIKVSVSEDQPAVAMDAQGNFVVAWREHEPNGNTDVLAQKFNASGQAITGVIPVGVGTFYQHEPSVAMAANGNFVVAYTRDTNDNNPDVFAKAYNASGQLLTVITVAASPLAESNPKVGAWDMVDDYEVAGPSVEYQASGGYFAVAYTEVVGDDSPVSVEIVVVNPSNIISTSYNVSGYWVPSITNIQSFAFLVTYVGFGNGKTLTNDIYGLFGFYD